MPRRFSSSPSDEGAAEACQVLRRLRTTLNLTFDQLGQLLGVSGETARCWERELRPIPSERLADVSNAGGALDCLLRYFVPERLSVATRQPAELFGGNTALDWILGGHIREIADRYDQVLAYQYEAR